MRFLMIAAQLLTAQTAIDPFAFFQVTMTADDRQTLDAGEPLVRVIPSEDREIAVWAAVPVDIDGDRLVAWVRQIEALKKSGYVTAIRRFSVPPRIDDLADLTLDEREVADILECRPRHCGLKLTAAEMSDLQRAAADAGTARADAVRQQFRRMVLDRVNAYLAGSEIGPFEDHSTPVWPARRFAAVVEHSSFLGAQLPAFAQGLRSAPTPDADIEAFMYWSKERIADRAIISVTDVRIVRGQAANVPDVLVAGKEVFATHYIDGSLGLTALVRSSADGPSYLVYVNRSEIDVLHGMFAGLIRWVVQRRLKAEARGVLLGLRERLESGDPPAQR